jgi:hypothetical protein
MVVWISVCTRGWALARRFFSAVNISTTWRRRWSSAASAWVSSSFQGRGVGWIAWPKRASTRASKASVLARHPKALAKSRAWRGLMTAVSRCASTSAAATDVSKPPVASRTIRRGERACSQPVSSAKPASSRDTRNRSWAGQVATSRWALATSIPTQHSPSSGGWTAVVAGFWPERGSSANAAGGLSRSTRCSASSAAWTAAATGCFFMMCSLSRPCTMRVLAPATVRASGSPNPWDKRGASSSLTGSSVPEGYRATTSITTLPNFKHTRGIVLPRLSPLYQTSNIQGVARSAGVVRPAILILAMTP